ALKGFVGSSVPKVNASTAKQTMRSMGEAIENGLVKACHDISEGGLAVALAEMAFTGGYGVEISLEKVPVRGLTRNDFILFSESNSRFIVEVSEKSREEFEKLMRGTVCGCVGKVTRTSSFCVYGLEGEALIDVSIDVLRRRWKSGLGGSQL
ncbi:MAG TPA: phosphoribosylformylglycinamidine synthase, partial [Candidatus Bathyarchaeota archaeon]|nr:phosphoribosylformylglycinamidine synthase [Candidatus Bathyarchaeota archaeon]